MPAVDENDIRDIKITMLEAVVRDIFTEAFLANEDPVAAATTYAEQRIRIARSATLDPELEPIRHGVWQQYLDSIVAQVTRRYGRRRG